ADRATNQVFPPGSGRSIAHGNLIGEPASGGSFAGSCWWIARPRRGGAGIHRGRGWRGRMAAAVRLHRRWGGDGRGRGGGNGPPPVGAGQGSRRSAPPRELRAAATGSGR